MNFWNTLMLPALSGQHEHIHAVAQQLRGRSPSSAHARIDAITARALLTVGDAEAAVAPLDRALAADDFEAAALARMIFTDGPARCMEHLSSRAPGQAADAACDLTWHCHRQGDLPGAQDAVRRGLLLCPDHIELRRWKQALCAFRMTDHLTLYPCSQRGWMSLSRLRRRPSGHAIHSWDGALGRLQDAGVWSRRLASSRTYATLAVTDPCAGLEAGIELAWATLRCGRPVEPMLETLWRNAMQHQAIDLYCMAQAVTQIALQMPVASRAGRAAAEVLTCAAPQEPRWQAMMARMLAAFGQPAAVKEARAVLARQELDAATWGLAHSALVLMGHRREAQALAASALGRPGLMQAAQRALSASGALHSPLRHGVADQTQVPGNPDHALVDGRNLWGAIR